MNLVDRIVVPSRHSAATLDSIGITADRVHIIPYGVDPLRESSDGDSCDVRDAMLRARAGGRLVLACVGTISPRKNQTVLVDAIARLGADLPVLCVFIGDGDIADLKARILRTGCGDRFVLHGYSRAARSLAAAADVVVLPSQSEGQPVTILEAFCDGRLVLVSDIAELVELVQDGDNGFCFAAGNADALAQRVRDIAALPTSVRRCIQDRARVTCSERFTAPAMHRAYMRLYDSVITGQRGEGHFADVSFVPLLSRSELHVAKERPAKIGRT